MRMRLTTLFAGLLPALAGLAPPHGGPDEIDPRPRALVVSIDGLIRITSYNVCYTKLLRIANNGC